MGYRIPPPAGHDPPGVGPGLQRAIAIAIGVFIVPVALVCLKVVAEVIYRGLIRRSDTIESLVLWVGVPDGTAIRQAEELAGWTAIVAFVAALLLIPLAIRLRRLPGTAIHVVWTSAIAVPVAAYIHLVTPLAQRVSSFNSRMISPLASWSSADRPPQMPASAMACSCPRPCPSRCSRIIWWRPTALAIVP